MFLIENIVVLWEKIISAILVENMRLFVDEEEDDDEDDVDYYECESVIDSEDETGECCECNLCYIFRKWMYLDTTKSMCSKKSN